MKRDTILSENRWSLLAARIRYTWKAHSGVCDGNGTSEDAAEHTRYLDDITRLRCIGWHLELSSSKLGRGGGAHKDRPPGGAPSKISMTATSWIDMAFLDFDNPISPYRQHEESPNCLSA